MQEHLVIAGILEQFLLRVILAILELAEQVVAVTLVIAEQQGPAVQEALG